MAPIRKEKFASGHVYHIYSRSIARFKIFNSNSEYQRFFDLMNFLRHKSFDYSFSRFDELSENHKKAIAQNLKKKNDLTVKIVAYCLMPTHIHLILEQNKDHGIEQFVSRVLNGYSKYFNIKHKRNGPLWSSRFSSVLVEDDEQLLHLTRYLHLNPTSAGLVEKPEEWQFSSYNEYIDSEKHICDYDMLLKINPKDYKKFVKDRIAYQKDLSLIKSILIDNYTG